MEDYTIKMETVTYTPREAEFTLLNYNIRNRPMTASSVEMLLGHITNNTFMYTHQGIARDRNGYIMDGQNRLKAISKSDRPVKIAEYTYSIDLILPNGQVHPVMLALDKGRVRTIGQNLRLNGMMNANLVAAICNVIRGLLLGGGSSRASETVIEAIYSLYHEDIDAIVSLGWGVRDRKATLFAPLIMLHSTHQHEAIALATKLATFEGLTAKSAEMALSRFAREQLGQMNGYKHREEAVDRVINACMKYLDHEPVVSLCANDVNKRRFLAMHELKRKLLQEQFK